MRVVLTNQQLDILSDVFCKYDLEWAAKEWLTLSSVLPGHTSTRAVVMPAIGWQTAIGALVEFTVGPLGGNSKGASVAARNARTRIAQALHLYLAHPAWSSVGLYGDHAEVFPAWILTESPLYGPLYSPYPTRDGQFVHLMPERVSEFTVWRAREAFCSHSTSVLQEECHLRFVRGSQPDARASATPS